MKKVQLIETQAGWSKYFITPCKMSSHQRVEVEEEVEVLEKGRRWWWLWSWGGRRDAAG